MSSMSIQRATISLCIALLACGATSTVSAHDFASGRSMGIAPKLLELQAEQEKLIPSDLAPDAARNVRGVMLLSVRWPQNATLKVCYLSGTRQARERATKAALELQSYMNLNLDFGTVTDPRRCKGDNSEQIKIGFVNDGPDAGYWSYLGTQSTNFPHSMNLGGFGANTLPIPEAEFRGIVLHEFGHALGLLHEHQSPKAGCDAELDPTQLKNWANRVGWDEQQLQVNIKAYLPAKEIRATPHDRASIMHYSLPPELFKSGKNSKCWVPKNNVLSVTDKTFIASIYPKSIPVAGLPTRGLPADGGTAGKASGKPPGNANAEAQFQDEVVSQYREALVRAGVKQADSLAAQFGASLKADRKRVGTTP
jgi:Astacin (Peptidase family M12A)